MNAGWAIQNILYWLRETERVTVQILKDVNDDYERSVFDCSKLYNEGLEKSLWRYELNCTGSQYGAVVGLCGQWWTCRKNIIHHIVIKHNIGWGSSQSPQIPVMYTRPLKSSRRSWLQWFITMLIPASVTLGHQRTAKCFKCLHLQIQS